MLIDTKVVKRLNFPFCKSNAIYLLVDYMERNTEIQFMQQRIPSLIEFMEWQYSHDFRIIDQDSINEYITFIYDKKAFGTAETVCSYVKSFCKYLVDEGFCGFVSFSSKPHNSSRNNDKDFVSEKEQSKEQQQDTYQESSQNTSVMDDDFKDDTTKSNNNKASSSDNAGDNNKRKRGRPKKSEQNSRENISENFKSSDNDDNNKDEEKNKRRRGRPKKDDDTKLRRVTNYYDFFGVSPDEDISKIKDVYKKLATKVHPDTHQDNDIAEKRMYSLNFMITVLKDEVERMVYDVTMGFREYDYSMEHLVKAKGIQWYTKKHYTVMI